MSSPDRFGMSCKVMIRQHVPFILALLFVSTAVRAEESLFQLAPARQKVVDRYMNILLDDARNEVAFQRVYNAFKEEGKEYLLVNFVKNAIRLQPGKAGLRIILGQLYAAFKDLHQAGVELKAAARQAPKNFYARFLLASVYFKQARYGAAAVEFKTAAALATGMDDRVRCLSELARVYGTVEQWDEARKIWEEVADLRRSDLEGFRALAEVCRDFKQWDLAERWLKRMLELARLDSETSCGVLMELGEIFFEQKRFAESSASYRKAKALVSESHWLSEELNKRIRVCFEQEKRSEELRRQLEAALEEARDDVARLLELSEILMAEGDLKRAAENLEAASEASPRDVHILERLRALLIRLKDDDGFEAVSKRLLALSPQNVHYKLQDADYYVSRANLERAKAIWDEVIKEDPKGAARYLSVARAMIAAGKLDWAESTYSKLIEIAGGVHAYKIELASLYLRRAEELLPEGSPVKDWVERSQGYFKKAEDLLLEVSGKDDLTLPETQLAGALLLGRRRLETARKVLRLGKDRFPKDMGLVKMYGESCLFLGVIRPSGSQEQWDLFGEAVDSSLQAFDLAPHPAIQRELNSELVGLCLGYGRNTSGNVRQGGLGGLRVLLKKHATDFFGRPKDPMPAWCIADVQRQAPDGVLDLKNVKGGPAIFRVYMGRAGRTKSGLPYFNRSVDRDPLFVPGYLGKAFAYGNEDSFEQAVIELRKASIIDPVNKWKYFLQIGDLYAREGQMEEALAFWDRVSERVFTDATVFFQLGTRYFRAEKTGKTVEMLKKAIQINPEIAAYHMTLGNVYDYLKRYRDAVTEFRKALESSSQGMLLSVRRRLSEIQLAWAYELFDKKDYAAALQQFEEIRAFQEVMEAHYRKNNDELALKHLSPEAADVQVQMARCHEFAGRKETAQAIYDRAAKEMPEAQIRLDWKRTMSLASLLKAQKTTGGIKPDNLRTAGTVKPRPFRLKKVRHIKLFDVGAEHSMTPEGLLYSGKSEWVKVDQLSGRIIEQVPSAGKAVRYRNGVEVQVVNGRQGDGLRFVKDGKLIPAVGLAYPWNGVARNVRIRLSDLQIIGGRVYLFADARPHDSWARIVAIDTTTGKVVLDIRADQVKDFSCDGQYIAALKSQAHRSSLLVYDAENGKLILDKELASTGVWLEPVVWQGKVFLLDDIDWKLHALDARQGSFDYTVAFEGTFPRPPLLHENVLYLHVRAYKERTIYLHAIEPTTGRIIWRTNMQAMSVHSPPIFRGPDIIYLNPETHRVFMIDKATGHRHAEAGYRDQLTEQQLLHIQKLDLSKDHLLLVGSRGSINVFRIDEK